MHDPMSSASALPAKTCNMIWHTFTEIVKFVSVRWFVSSVWSQFLEHSKELTSLTGLMVEVSFSFIILEI